MSVDQLAKFLLCAVGPAASDVLFMAAVRTLRRPDTLELMARHEAIFGPVLRTFGTAAAVRCLEQPELDVEALLGLVPHLRALACPGSWAGDRAPLEAARRRVAEVLAASGKASDESAYDAVWIHAAQRRSLEALFVEGLYLGETAALTTFAVTLARGGAYAPIDGRAAILAESLVEGGWFEAMGPVGLARLGRALCRAALAADTVGLSYLMHGLGYSWNSPQAHVAALSDNVFFPLIGRLYDLGRAETAAWVLQWALAIDRAPDALIVDRARHLEPVVTAAVAAGRRLADVIDGPGARTSSAPAPGRIGFIVSSFATPETLGQLVELAPRLRGFLGPDCEIGFYLLDGFSERLDAQLESADIARWWAGDAGARPLNALQRLHDLRERLRADSIRTAIWCDSLHLGFFALASRLAPTQLLLTQRPLAVRPPVTVAHAISFDVGAAPRGEGWTLPWCAPAAAADEDFTAGDERRAALNKPGSVMIGAVVSDSRLWSPAFLETVGAILRERANAVFVWAGADLDPERLVRGVGEALAPRVLHLDLPVEAFVRAVDIVLEPFECTDSRMALEAMAAGAPVVGARATPSLFVRAVTTLLGGPGRRPRRGSDADTLADAVADNAAAFVRQTLGLIDDVGRRRALGEALRAAHLRAFGDLDAGAEGLARYLRTLGPPTRRASEPPHGRGKAAPPSVNARKSPASV
jgi:hypothetical protein